MRKYNNTLRILFSMLLSFIMIQTQAQTGLNFQGVARNSNNVILASQPITIRLSILQGSATGTADYTETRKVTTNAQGLFTAIIGDTGTMSSLGSFAAINWKTTPKFLKIEMDPAAGSNFITMGTTQFQYVAYAQFAKTVDAENIVGIVPVTLGGTGVNSLTGLKSALAIDLMNNTSDANKPISTATQTALDLKLDASAISNTTLTSLSTVGTNGQVLTSTGFGTLTWTTPSVTSSQWSSNGSNVYFATGNVGIGTNSPTTTLDITGSLKTTGTINSITVGMGGGSKNQNAAFGYETLNSNTTGQINNGFGYRALYSNTTAGSNNAFGNSALYTNTSGSGNNAFGYLALYKNTIGSSNASYGQSSLYLNTTGSNNTAIGYEALKNNTTGSYNTAIGYQADVSSISLSNTTAIGNGALVSSSNTIRLGNIAVTNVNTSGTLTAGAVTYPNTHGTSGQILTSTGSGTLTWTTPVFLPTIVIGTQQWMKENLDVLTYRNGDIIPQVTDPTAWAALTTGAWCYYNNDAENGETYGKLYNWYAINDPRGLAPQGWHIPTDAEWTTLSTLLGGDLVAGGKMKTTGTSKWSSSPAGTTNESGFGGLPGGLRIAGGGAFNIGNHGYFWSITEDNATNAKRLGLHYYDGEIERLSDNKKNGFSVRCVRD